MGPCSGITSFWLAIHYQSGIPNAPHRSAADVRVPDMPVLLQSHSRHPLGEKRLKKLVYHYSAIAYSNPGSAKRETRNAKRRTAGSRIEAVGNAAAPRHERSRQRVAATDAHDIAR